MKKEKFKTYHQEFGEIWKDGKMLGWKGKIIPKTAQELIDECSIK